MRLFSSLCVLLGTCLLSVLARQEEKVVMHAGMGSRSIAGNRLLVVLEDALEKDLYSQLWTDLECESKTALQVVAPTD